MIMTQERGCTPVHLAAALGRERLLYQLLRVRDASLTMRTNEGLTPFDLACQHARGPCVVAIQNTLQARCWAWILATRRRRRSGHWLPIEIREYILDFLPESGIPRAMVT